MRAIIGTPDKPCSSYILVIRGLDEKSIEYFMRHVKMYPTWGCILFPEYMENPMGVRLKMLEKEFVLHNSAIHRIFASDIYAIRSDVELVKDVKNAFPPYREDDDPVLDRGQLLMAAIKGDSEAMKILAKENREYNKVTKSKKTE